MLHRLETIKCAAAVANRVIVSRARLEIEVSVPDAVPHGLADLSVIGPPSQAGPVGIEARVRDGPDCSARARVASRFELVTHAATNVDVAARQKAPMAGIDVYDG